VPQGAPNAIGSVTELGYAIDRAVSRVSTDARDAAARDASDMAIRSQVADGRARDSAEAGPGRRARRAARPLQAKRAPGVTLESLSAGWRGAFDVAEHALDAAAGQLSGDDLAERRSRLRSERASTALLLGQIASLHEDRDAFVSLMIPRSQLKPLLGVPVDVQACVFNLDGVLIGSAAAHAAAWSETFDEFINRRVERTHGGFAPFNPRVDYVTYIHGKPRLEGVRAFLASRGIRLPEGEPGDAPELETVHGLANRKQQALMRHLEEHGITAFAGARRYLELSREVGVRTAVVSASVNTRTILHRAGLAGLIDGIVDGNTIAAEGLQAKPAPDTLLAASQEVQVDPAHVAVFETSPAGVQAARIGGFELTIGVGRGDQADHLRIAGADVIVPDLADLITRRLNGSSRQES
jgi:beta-phosphoglucomutase-like phosphatase (HAD superfamily)